MTKTFGYLPIKRHGIRETTMQYHKKPAIVEGTEQWFSIHPSSDGNSVEYKDGNRTVIESDVSIPLRECR